MAITKLYNKKTVASNFARVSTDSGTFTYRGFSSDNNKKNYKLYDLDLVKQDLLNHFYIRKGEKLENPSFGTVIWDILFENFTEEVKQIVSQDVETILNYDPRISVNAVIIDTTDQGLRIEADVTYLPFNINERMVLNFDKSNNTLVSRNNFNI
jgi:phage baseplate assembly protein W